MTGGMGADTFVFKNGEVSNGWVDGQGNRHIDVITDLSWQDNIDFSDIDADVHTAGNQDFHTVFGHFTGEAGELMYMRTATGDLDTYLFQGDLTGDGLADFTIEVHAFNSFHYTL